MPIVDSKVDKWASVSQTILPNDTMSENIIVLTITKDKYKTIDIHEIIQYKL